jgi:hypothetical protein
VTAGRMARLPESGAEGFEWQGDSGVFLYGPPE